MLTRFGPNFLMRDITSKLNKAPLRLKKKEDADPEKRAVRLTRTKVNSATCGNGRVNKEITVIKLANPSFAPGANTKGEGKVFSIKPITIPCAANIEI